MDPVNIKRKAAFEDTNPDFVIMELVATKYELILNKYCVLRPQFVLHTRLHEPQATLLGYDDLDAAWLALVALGHLYMAIYNGGKDAGASVGHKHLQILPRPSSFGLDSLIMKQLRHSGQDRADDKDSASMPMKHSGLTSALSAVPYQLAVRILSGDMDISTVHHTYNMLREELTLDPDTPNNLIVTHDCIALIPRQRACIEEISGYTANAAAMMGMVWVQSEDLFNRWLQYGPMRVLSAQARTHGREQSAR